MTRDVAEHILGIALRQSAELAGQLPYLRQHLEPDEYRHYERSIAEVLANTLIGIINPIVAEHEDLRPPELAKTSRGS